MTYTDNWNIQHKVAKWNDNTRYYNTWQTFKLEISCLNEHYKSIAPKPYKTRKENATGRLTSSSKAFSLHWVINLITVCCKTRTKCQAICQWLHNHYPLSVSKEENDENEDEGNKDTCCISTNEALETEASPLSIILCSKALICLLFSWISRSMFWIYVWDCRQL